MPRILFYCVIIFGLLASHFEWLVAGALAAALTYGDLDLYALVAVLSTSCLITIPLINWSTTLRKFGSRDGHEHRARTIVIYWGALVLVGLITTLTTFWNKTDLSSNFSTLNPITCHPPESQMSYGAGQDPLWRGFAVDTEWVQENGCADPCQQSSFYWQPAIFRSYSDLQLLSKAEVQLIHHVASVLPSDSFFTAYEYFGIILGLFLISQGVWALCFGRRNHRQARDIIYSFLQKSQSRLPFSALQGGRWRE